MLTNLVIKNFALIKDLEIEFGEKLNVISGETGSGKSLLMKALKFALGDRADKSNIRYGEDSAKVQCVFSGLKEQTLDIARDNGIEIDECLIISRTINQEGKSDIRINGNICTLATLNKITKSIVDFYGQQEHYSLLDNAKQIEVVDSFGGDEIKELKRNLISLKQRKGDIESKICQNFGNEREKAHKLEILEYEIKELEDNNFEDNEEELLRDKKLKFQSLEKIQTNLDNVSNILNYGASNSSLSNAFKEISNSLRAIEKYDSGVCDLLELCDNLRFTIEDFDDKVSNLQNCLSGETINIDEIEQKLDVIKMLKSKYGNCKEDRVAYLNKSKEEYDYIVNNDKIVKQLNVELNEINNSVISICDKLYQVREKNIEQIEQKLMNNLKDLDMKNAQFKILHTMSNDLNDLTNNGLDKIEFMFNANLGQTLKPLCKIISGGELSRFMLAYKNVVMLKDEIDLLIFDEIDSGISGIVGQKVACKINDIASICQVISISHLPQIVSMADNNIYIYKKDVNGETVTQMEILKDERLLAEIARLSGSKEMKEIDLQFANEQRQYAQKYKNN